MTRSTRARVPVDLLIGSGALAVFLVLFTVFALTEWFGSPKEYVRTGVVAYCEGPTMGLVEQPVNTLSNLLGPVVVGLVLLGFVWHDQQRTGGVNRLQRFPFYGRMFGYTALFLGPGSMLYHASLTDWGGWFDNMSMFFIVLFMGQYSLFRLNKWHSRGVFLGVYIAAASLLGTVLAVSIAADPDLGLGKFFFGGLVAGAIIIEICVMTRDWIDQPVLWFWLGILTFGLSILVWALSDTGRPLCDPSSVLQGHALWHIGTAVAVLFFYFYYRSERTAS